jgi:uncharacterized membrane protein
VCYEVVLILNHKVYWEAFLVDLWLVHIYHIGEIIYHKIIPWIGEIWQSYYINLENMIIIMSRNVAEMLDL